MSSCSFKPDIKEICKIVEKILIFSLLTFFALEGKIIFLKKYFIINMTIFTFFVIFNQ